MHRGAALVVAVATLLVGACDDSGSDPPAQAGSADALNVVLVVTDDQSYESLVQMPFVNGRSDWIRFDNAFINNPVCCPSRATILTGLYSHHTGVETNRDGRVFDDSSTVATWLDDAGYETALVGKYLNGYPWGDSAFVPPGWDHWRAFMKKGYEQYSLYEADDADDGEVREYSGADDYVTDLLAGQARELVGGFGDDPFFLMFTPNAPHAPARPAPRHRGTLADVPIAHPPNYDEADVSDKPEWVRDLPRIDEREVDRDRRHEYETLLAVDEAVSSLFDALTAQDELDDTVVIFMTDNGYTFGEHRWKLKTCPYEECARTPLLVRYPGQAGGTVDALISNVDLAPSLAALAGIEPPGGRDGDSFVPFLEGARPASWRTAVLLHAVREGRFDAEYWGIRTRRYKYVEYDNGDLELYDLRVDPYELENRARRPQYAEVQNRLARQLEELRR